MIQKQVEEKEISIREESQLKFEKMNEHQEELRRQLKQTKDDLTTSQQQTSILHSQLFDMKSKFDKEMVAKRAEIDMISNEIERTNAAYQELRGKYATLLQSNEPQDKPHTNWEEIVQKDMEIAQLREIVSTLKEKQELHQSEIKSSVSKLNSELELQISKNQVLQSQVSRIPDPEYVSKLENKLKVLEALCGNYVREEDGQSVEAALRNKNRLVNTELIQLKGELSSTSTRLTQAEKKNIRITTKFITKTSHVK